MAKRVIFREGLTSILSGAQDTTVLATCATIEELAPAINECVPDVLVMDTDMLDSKCIQYLEELKVLHTNLPFVFLTTSTDLRQVIQALKMGTRGYLSKAISDEALIESVRLVADGELVISCPIAEELIKKLLSSNDIESVNVNPAERLTPRESEVLSLASEGLRNSEIASRLFISDNTVKAHMRNAMEKFRTHTRQGAVSLFFNRVKKYPNP